MPSFWLTQNKNYINLQFLDFTRYSFKPKHTLAFEFFTMNFSRSSSSKLNADIRLAIMLTRLISSRSDRLLAGFTWQSNHSLMVLSECSEKKEVRLHKYCFMRFNECPVSVLAIIRHYSSSLTSPMLRLPDMPIMWATSSILKLILTFSFSGRPEIKFSYE